jgi:hypothetical protein
MHLRIPVLSLGSLAVCGSGCGAAQAPAPEPALSAVESNAAMLALIADGSGEAWWEGSSSGLDSVFGDGALYLDGGAIGVGDGLGIGSMGYGVTGQLSGLSGQGVNEAEYGAYDAYEAYDTYDTYDTPPMVDLSPEDTIALQNEARTFCAYYADCVYDENPPDLETYVTSCKQYAQIAAEHGTVDCAPALIAFFACVREQAHCMPVDEIPEPPYLPYYRIVGCSPERDRARSECHMTE